MVRAATRGDRSGTGLEPAARAGQVLAEVRQRGEPVLVGGNFSSFDGQDRPGLVAIVRSGP